MRTANIGGMQGERRLETRECPKPTVVHCSSVGDQQGNQCEGHSPHVVIRKRPGSSSKPIRQTLQTQTIGGIEGNL